MNRREFDFDHIDPVWRDGRDYQLVCGFKRDPKNLREEDPSINTAKSNRFLPWRWCRDEIGVVPEEPGDLALFLVNGEWVLMEFMSDEWFEASRHTCALSRGNEKQWVTLRNNPDQLAERNQKIQESLVQRRVKDPKSEEERIRKSVEGNQRSREENPELWDNIYKSNSEKFREAWKELPDQEKKRRLKNLKEAGDKAREDPEVRQKMVEGARAQAQKRYQCLITGYVSTAQWVTIHQRKLGIEPIPQNRIRIQ